MKCLKRTSLSFKATFVATVIAIAAQASWATADESNGHCHEHSENNAELSLENAIDTALRLNATTRSSWTDIKAQTAQVGIARSAFLPTVNSSLTIQSNNTSSAGFGGAASHTNGYSAYLGLNWRLFDFGARAAQQGAAEHLLLAALASHDDAVRKTLSETVRSYFSALQAQGTLNARQRASAQARNTLAAAQRREGKGVTSRSDTLQAETALARARLAEHRAKADFTKSVAALVYVMGLPTDTPLVLPERMPTVPRDTLPDLSELLADARAHHPAVLASRAQRDAGHRSVAAARAEGRPTVDFSVAHYRNGYPNQGVQANRSNSVQAGITLTIPLFDGFSRNHKISQAQALAEKRAIEATDIEHQILGQLVNVHADVAASIDGIETTDQLLTAAEASLQSATNRYDHGVADILELINAQTAMSDALEARAQSTAQFNTARLKLLIEAGRIDRDGLTALNLGARPTP